MIAISLAEASSASSAKAVCAAAARDAPGAAVFSSSR